MILGQERLILSVKMARRSMEYLTRGVESLEKLIEVVQNDRQQELAATDEPDSGLFLLLIVNSRLKLI